MPLLLEPVGLRGSTLQARAVDRRMVPRVPRSQGAGRAAARALRRRAHAAAGSGRAGPHRAWPGAVYVVDQLGLPALPGAAGGPEGRRARPRADQRPGRRRRGGASPRARLGTALETVWVLPDYHEQFPKPCMGGWARAYMTVTPAGEVWPWHAAGRITTLTFENVRDHPLEWIWEHSETFNRFRGESWMPEPCRSCP